MPLPALTMPAGLPMWLAEGYAMQPEPLFGHAPMSTGHTRTRRLFTVADRIERASLLLLRPQLPTWQTFYEQDLEAGLQRFAARFSNIGPGLVWFDAQIVEYTSTPRAPGFTTIACTLRLRGSPSTTGPT